MGRELFLDPAIWLVILKKSATTQLIDLRVRSMVRCKGCKNKFSKKDESFFRLECGHGFCRACLTQRCSATVASNRTNSWVSMVLCKRWLSIARCDCGHDIPFLTVTRILDGEELQEYERLWRGGRVACVSCSNSEFSASICVVSCGHTYCRDCIHRMSRLALSDRSLVPLRCCKREFPVEYVQEALDKEGFTKYTRILGERDWKTSDLITDAEYARSVQSIGAKHCPGCGVGVERDFGCVHMKCLNGHEFCYTCLKPWRTCQCDYIPAAEIQAILGEH